MFFMVPAVLSMVPALKYVGFDLKIVPWVTAFAERRLGLRRTRNSKAFMGLVGIQVTFRENVFPPAMVCVGVSTLTVVRDAA